MIRIVASAASGSSLRRALRSGPWLAERRMLADTANMGPVERRSREMASKLAGGNHVHDTPLDTARDVQNTYVEYAKMQSLLWGGVVFACGGAYLIARAIKSAKHADPPAAAAEL